METQSTTLYPSEGVRPETYDAGEAKDLIYEQEVRISDLTQFIFRVFDNKTFDNSEATSIFISVGIAVSLVLATWEFFRSREIQKKIEASLAESKFLSNISHEIRTPINGIVGIADVLSKQSLPEVW